MPMSRRLAGMSRDVAAIEQARGRRPAAPGRRARAAPWSCRSPRGRAEPPARRGRSRASGRRARAPRRSDGAGRPADLTRRAGSGGPHRPGSLVRLRHDRPRRSRAPAWSTNESRKRSSGRQKQRRERDRYGDARIALALEVDDHLEVSKASSEEIVNSPSTSATETSAARHHRAHDVGYDDPPDHAEPGAAEAAAGLGEGHEIDGREPGCDARGRRRAAPGPRRRRSASAPIRRTGSVTQR